MEILTRDYGLIEIDTSALLRFDEGIIGFEEYHSFVLLDISDGQSPLRCLQSTEDSSLAFILLDPFYLRPDYEVVIDDEVVAKLSVDSSDDIVILAIVVVPENIKLMSINLKAPIIINARVKKGIQYILDCDDYNVRHYLNDELDRVKNLKVCESQTAV